MKKKISVLIVAFIATMFLGACSNKEDSKDKDFDNVRRKLEQNSSSGASSSGTAVSNNKIGSGNITGLTGSEESIKELTDFENNVKENNELLKSAYKEKIEAQESAMEIRLKEQLEMELEKSKLGLKVNLKLNIKKETQKDGKKQEQNTITDKYKEELQKQKKAYEEKKKTLKKIFEDYDNKIKEAESKRDVVVRAMTILDENNANTKKALNETKDEIAKNIVKNISKEVVKIEFDKYKSSINEVVKWRNNELLKIK